MPTLQELLHSFESNGRFLSCSFILFLILLQNRYDIHCTYSFNILFANIMFAVTRPCFCRLVSYLFAFLFLNHLSATSSVRLSGATRLHSTNTGLKDNAIQKRVYNAAWIDCDREEQRRLSKLWTQIYGMLEHSRSSIWLIRSGYGGYYPQTRFIQNFGFSSHASFAPLIEDSVWSWLGFAQDPAAVDLRPLLHIYCRAERSRCADSVSDRAGRPSRMSGYYEAIRGERRIILVH